MTKEEKYYREKYPNTKELSYMDRQIIEILEEYAQQSKPEHIDTVNPEAYMIINHTARSLIYVSFDDMKGRTVSEEDEITPLYTMQLKDAKPSVSDEEIEKECINYQHNAEVREQGVCDVCSGKNEYYED